MHVEGASKCSVASALTGTRGYPVSTAVYTNRLSSNWWATLVQQSQTVMRWVHIHAQTTLTFPLSTTHCYCVDSLVIRICLTGSGECKECYCQQLQFSLLKSFFFFCLGLKKKEWKIDNKAMDLWLCCSLQPCSRTHLWHLIDQNGTQNISVVISHGLWCTRFDVVNCDFILHPPLSLFFFFFF